MIQNDPHVSGQSNAPRVGYALTVKDEDVGPDRQLLERT
jgi:hypothetical protein